MSIFQTIKENITLRQAAERYGLPVNNKGMTRCPFHQDDRPSLKLNEDYFYCFGCRAHGDVTNLVARLFGISQYRAAQRLAADFGLDPRSPTQVRQPVPAFKQKQERQQQIQRKELFCISTLDGRLVLKSVPSAVLTALERTEKCRSSVEMCLGQSGVINCGAVVVLRFGGTDGGPMEMEGKCMAINVIANLGMSALGTTLTMDSTLLPFVKAKASPDGILT